MYGTSNIGIGCTCVTHSKSRIFIKPKRNVKVQFNMCKDHYECNTSRQYFFILMRTLYFYKNSNTPPEMREPTPLPRSMWFGVIDIAFDIATFANILSVVLSNVAA